MLALDTNVVVRYLTDDHPEQSPKAAALIESERVYITRTVLLETDWVLRSAFRLRPARILDRLRAFVALPTVTVEEPDVVATAFEWAEQGLDFADALHLAKAAGCSAFATFDRACASVARRVTDAEIRAL